MEVTYRQPVPINLPLAVRARVSGSEGRRVYVHGEICDPEKELASAVMTFVHVPLEHFLITPEGQQAGERWRRWLETAS